MEMKVIQVDADGVKDKWMDILGNVKDLFLTTDCVALEGEKH